MEIGMWAEFMKLMERADNMHAFLQGADATGIVLKNLKYWLSMMLSFVGTHSMAVIKVFSWSALST